MMRKHARLPAVLAATFTGAILAISTAHPAEPGQLPAGVGPVELVQGKKDPADEKKMPEAKKEPEEKKTQPKELPEVQPRQPEAPASTPAPTPAPITPGGGGSGGGIFGNVGGGGGGGAAPAANPASTGGGLSASQQAAPTTGSSVVGGGEATARATSDLGDLLGKSISALGVEVHNRSPIVTEPFIRGYHIGQYITQSDGAFWMPARQDLDTIVSKIDSSQIENVVIIKGPYSVRYGPGFSFLDVETLGTPRYQNGPEVHESTSLTYKTNGEQWFGLQSFWGGSDTFGFRLAYTGETGANYTPGNNVLEPSAFQSHTFNLALGWNIGQYGKIEIKGTHIDQPRVEIPGSFFDLSDLGTDAYTGRFIYDDPNTGKFILDSWFNNTRLAGNNFGGDKRNQLAFFDNSFANAGIPNVPYEVTTNAEMASWGYRAAYTWGGRDQPQVTLGADLHCLDGQANEFDNAIFDGKVALAPPFPPTPIVNAASNFPIPRSYSTDPGLFLDTTLPIVENRLKINAGVRFDWVRTAISDLVPPSFPGSATTNTVGTPTTLLVALPTETGTYFPDFAFSGKELQHDYSLWAAFITPEWKVTERLTFLAGFGYAQRPPTFTELYAEDPFLGVIQNGVNFVQGNPLLAPETTRQLDLGFKWNNATVRTGLNGFGSLIHNYITYHNLGPNAFPPVLGFGYQYVNTKEAVLAGCEAYAEWDATRWLTLFGTLAYVEGRDLTLGSGFLPPGSTTSQEPLPSISPLESRIGFRLRDPGTNPKWGTEFATHIVAAQNEVATSLDELPSAGYTLFDVRAYWRYSNNLLLTAGIENIGNTAYREALDLRTGTGVFQPGRNYYFGARLTY
jgi:iron complex outermembrane recepter protein